MNQISIFFEDDTELAEYEAINKGYRLDVYVKIEDYIYNVRVYSAVRLQQDFESEVESYGFYAIESNLILVKDTNKEEIVYIINRLYEQEYFQTIKPAKNIEITQLKKIQ